MKLSIIAAASENNIIGDHNRLPWHLPEDLKYFKSKTVNKAIIMGRKTFDSIKRPLPQRDNIIITRDLTYKVNGAFVSNSIDKAILLANDLSVERGSDEIIIAGGAQIYQLALPLVSCVYLTRIHNVYNGDTYFPELDPLVWVETHKNGALTNSDNTITYSYLTFERIP